MLRGVISILRVHLLVVNSATPIPDAAPKGDAPKGDPAMDRISARAVALLARGTNSVN